MSLAKSIRNTEKSPYILAGFVTEDETYVDKRLMGVRVVKNDSSLVEEMKLRGATVLLVSPLYSERLRENTERKRRSYLKKLWLRTQAERLYIKSILRREN